MDGYCLQLFGHHGPICVKQTCIFVSHLNNYKTLKLFQRWYCSGITGYEVSASPRTGLLWKWTFINNQKLVWKAWWRTTWCRTGWPGILIFNVILNIYYHDCHISLQINIYKTKIWPLARPQPSTSLWGLLECGSLLFRLLIPAFASIFH